MLDNKLLGFNGNASNGQVKLNWTVSANNPISLFEVERSTDGINFSSVSQLYAFQDNSQISRYSAIDIPDGVSPAQVYYRLKITGKTGNISYSKTISLSLSMDQKAGVRITPNPVRNVMQVNITSLSDNTSQISIFDVTGKLIRTEHQQVSKGNNSVTLGDFDSWPSGIYTVKVLVGENLFTQKVVLVR